MNLLLPEIEYKEYPALLPYLCHALFELRNSTVSSASLGLGLYQTGIHVPELDIIIKGKFPLKYPDVNTRNLVIGQAILLRRGIIEAYPRLEHEVMSNVSHDLSIFYLAIQLYKYNPEQQLANKFSLEQLRYVVNNFNPTHRDEKLTKQSVVLAADKLLRSGLIECSAEQRQEFSLTTAELPTPEVSNIYADRANRPIIPWS